MTTLIATQVDRELLTDALDDVLEAADCPTSRGVASIVDVTNPAWSGEDAPRQNLAACLSRVATLMAIETPAVAEMSSSITETWVEPHLARGMAALTAELIRTVALTVAPGVGRIYVVCDWDGAQLVLALSSREAFRNPVLAASAARSLNRARRLAWVLQGELVRGVREDMMVYAATFAWSEDSRRDTSFGDRT